MQKQSQNVFTYYRGPSARGNRSDVGRQIEDNATASLLKILREADERCPQARDIILDVLIDSEYSPESMGIEVDDQVTLGSTDLKDREVFFTGLTKSDVGTDDDLTPREDNEGGRADGVIRIGSDVAIVLEVKTQGSELGTKQRERYAGELEIDDIDTRYHTATWLQLYNRLNLISSDIDDDVIRFLVDEFTEFLELTTLEQTIAVAPWTDDGDTKYNKISLRYHRPMNRRTALEPEQPDFHIEFKSTGYNAVSLGPTEWKEAVYQLPEEIKNVFLDQDFRPVENFAWNTLAKVGEDDGVRKLIESKPNEDSQRLVFQSKTNKPNSHYRRRPTIHEQDLHRYFDEDFGASLPTEGRLLEALFREGDLEEVQSLIGEVPTNESA